LLHEVAHGLFGQRIVLALHIADAEVELVPRRCRRRQGGQRGACARVSNRRWRQSSRRVTRTGVRQIERVARAASPGSADRRACGNRKLTAAEGLRHPRSIRVLAGIEGVATAPALGRAGRRCLRVLDDRRRSSNLLVITRLGLRRPIHRIRLDRGSRSDVGLADSRLTAGRGLRAALKQPQALFELPVSVLQLLILAGELPQLILELLNPHFRINILGLRESVRTQRQHRGHGHGMCNS